MEEIGKVLKQLRIELGLSQESEGAELGMSQAQISLYEKNGVDSLATLECFAEFFNTNVIDLLEMSKEDRED